MAKEAEKVTSDQRMGYVIQITQKLCRKKTNINISVRNKQWLLLTPEKEQEQET